jgi:hypothetical protein
MTPDPIKLTANLNQNCELFSGEDKVITIDMTGYDLATVTSLTWNFALSPYSTGEDVLLTKVQSDGIAMNGTDIDITIVAAETADINPDLYYHELKLVQADGLVKVAMTGNIVLRKSIAT